ncbi:ATP synthase subunit delta [Frankliniella fusca]|uniref:ATP synthase subunit delta n=1 Tax=Frankliniella fusca TaxID=407009 RepID=A0AAE1I0V7_9NEOP|nr:ATP synthase subunit delta [Frankliniella fusca]
MYGCPLCHVVLANPSTLGDHCGQVGCPRSFNNFKCLKKHLRVECTFPSPCPVFDNVTPRTADNTAGVVCTDDEVFINYTPDDPADLLSHISVEDVPCDDHVPCDDQTTNCNMSDIDLTELQNSALEFIAAFYANSDVSRSLVQDIMEKSTFLYLQCNLVLKKVIDELHHSEKISTEVNAKLLETISAISNPFSGLESEHLRFKKLIERGALVKPVSFVSGRRGVTSVTGQFMSMKHKLRRFFELPKVSSTVKSYVNELEVESENNTISNFIQDRNPDNPILEASNNSPIEEMNDLRANGITVVTEDGIFQIYFDIGLILGDNLGLHSILGLVECFTATFPCLYCKMSKVETESCCHEKCELIRNVDNYKNDLALNNTKLTGIKEECVFHEIEGFHVTLNPAVDFMHDILESGCCNYDLIEILFYFIEIKKYFTLDLLNNVIRSHDYGNVSNKPPLISETDLKSGKIRMSANEMLVFVQHLPSMIGNFIPQNDRYWTLFLFLYDILAILLCGSLQQEAIVQLDYFIVQHHLLYVELLGSSLKNKHHHMLHYPRIIRLSGPPVHYWSMRYEPMHRILKRYANVCFSRVNICMSIALKVELIVAFRILTKRGFSARFSMSASFEKSFASLESLYKIVCPGTFKSKCVLPKFVDIDGIHYTCDTTMCLAVDEIGLPVFGKIVRIIVNRQRDVCLVFSVFKTILLDPHLHIYKVEKTDLYTCVTFNVMPWRLPVFLHDKPEGYSVSLYHAL